MILANLATFPPRGQKLAEVVSKILPQVDKLNIVFNEYDKVPKRYMDKPRINAIIPDEDTKDTGKFLPTSDDDDYVFLIDDDIDYPENYVDKMLQAFSAVSHGEVIAGLYASIYKRPLPNLSVSSVRRFAAFYLFPRKIVRYRAIFSFHQNVDAPVFVDQLGTGTAVLRGRNMPPYEFMRGSQKFVDVRFARWCFENNIQMITLPREAYWLTWEDDGHSIFKNFTVTHPINVSKEIWSYAFKRPFVGNTLNPGNFQYDTRLTWKNQNT